MALCCKCGNFDDSHLLECVIEAKEYEKREDYQPDLYYYWDSPLEENYDWRTHNPDIDCLCEICFDILNHDNKIIWKDNKNPFKQPV